jgi:hypothetical protein
MLPSTLSVSFFASLALALPSSVNLQERKALYGSVGEVDYSSGADWYQPNLRHGSKSQQDDGAYSLKTTLPPDSTPPAPSNDATELPAPPKQEIDTSAYQCFKGDINKYPHMDDWVSFSEMWHVNEPLMRQGSSEKLVNAIKRAIIDTSKASKVDARLILAIVMQEVCFRLGVWLR